MFTTPFSVASPFVVPSGLELVSYPRGSANQKTGSSGIVDWTAYGHREACHWSMLLVSPLVTVRINNIQVVDIILLFSTIAIPLYSSPLLPYLTRLSTLFVFLFVYSKKPVHAHLTLHDSVLFFYTIVTIFPLLQLHFVLYSCNVLISACNDRIFSATEIS